MEPEEVRIRSLYLFFSCSQAIDIFAARLAATFPSPPLATPLLLQQSLKRELGILFRYWTTRHIWQRLDDNEADAKKLNLALLRLFTNGFRLPKDGSGLRYAELTTPVEETNELSHRITHALGVEHPLLLVELQQGILPWRHAVTKYTAEALELPIDQLAPRVRDLASRSPPRTFSQDTRD